MTLYLEGGYSAAAIVQQLGVGHSTLLSWVREYRAEGEVGEGQGFSRTDVAQYVEIPSSPSLEIAGQMAMELWVKRDSLSNPWQRFLNKKAVWNDLGGYNFEAGDNSAPGWSGNCSESIQVGAGGDDQARINSGIPWDTTSWHYIAAVIDGTTCQVYFDDTVPAMTKASIGFLAAGNSPLRFATDVGSISRLYGWLDEIRISNVPRSADWLWAACQNQASPATFNSYGNVLPDSFSGSVPAVR